MNEIVIMAGTTDPEKRLLSVIETLFPECAIRVVYAGSDRGQDRNSLQVSNRETLKGGQDANETKIKSDHVEKTN